MTGLTDTERAERLAAVVAAATRNGWRPEHISGSTAYLVRDARAAHLFHGVATLFTCGLWLPVWLIAAYSATDRRTSVTITSSGDAHWSHP